MTSEVWTVFLYELRRNVRRKAYLFATFGVPLLGMLFMVGYQLLGAGGFGPSLGPGGDSLRGLALNGIARAGYVDRTGEFADPGDLRAVFTLYPDETGARAALERGEIDVYYVIEAEYFETGDVTLVMPTLNLSQVNTDALERLLLQRLAREVDSATLFERLVTPSNLEEIRVQPDQPEGRQASSEAMFVVVYIFVIALMMSLFVTNGYLMQGLIEEKETRLIEILISSLRPLELLAGKILALGLLGLLQIATWVASMFLIARLGNTGAAGQAVALFARFTIPPGMIPLMLAYFLLAYLMFAAVYSIISALVNSTREGPQYAAVVTIPAVIPLWFTQLFVQTPDAPLPVFLSLFPLTAPLGMVQRVAVSSVPAWQIALSLLLLLLAVVGLMGLAARVFRVQTLLAGQTPRLRDLPGLIRG